VASGVQASTTRASASTSQQSCTAISWSSLRLVKRSALVMEGLGASMAGIGRFVSA